MSLFRTAYGNLYSENGWRMCNRAACERILIPGADNQFLAAMIVRSGPSEVVLRAWAIWYHRNVERLDLYKAGVGDDWGWSERNDVGNSNHLSGTGLDFNAIQYPWTLRTMPTPRKQKVREGLRLFEDNIFWGADWARADEMHYQLNRGTAYGDGASAKLVEFARRLEAGHLVLLAGTTVPPVLPKPAARPTLQRGSTGGDVTYLQALLNRMFASYSKLTVDGDFGPATESVVRQMQSRSNLAFDGIVGPATWRALGVK
ncbi:peptidoglycan-binding protein [Rhodococcus qingshengii]|uniref:peptidoglycan-binding protein n=1 Tax=Rhodococcus qingshengii TaxID=334542 RepID=UPI001BE7E02D|nr:peptidoglycan-binding protein [Rhodococcus qingshengii]MBT2272114.1 peptidoglycan-binding protein [Rhodococcus qingshengii]